MKVQVRYFASLREALGIESEQVETTASQADQLLDQLRARGGAYAQALAVHKPVRMAVNQVMAQPNTPLIDGAEVGFFPPVTGG